MALPFVTVASSFIGAISAGIIGFGISKVGHILAALGITLVIYVGIDAAITLLTSELVNLINNGSSGTVSAFNQVIPAGSYLMSIMSLMGVFTALNMIVSTVITAFSIKKTQMLLTRTLGGN